MDKQKRINWLKDRISSMELCRGEMPFGLSEDEEMELAAYKDSLASLTAVTIGWGLRRTDGDRGYGNWLTSSPRKQDYLDYQPHAYENVPLFTAPPVPEIKMPSRIENIHLRTPLEVEDMWIDRFKRLNGLGE